MARPPGAFSGAPGNATRALAGALRLSGGPAPTDRLRPVLDGLGGGSERWLTLESGPCALAWTGNGGEHDGLVAAADGIPVGAGATGPAALARAVRGGGPEAAARLAGQFAGVVWDPDAQRLVLVRDAGPTRSLFYVEDDGLLLWASELRALRAGMGRPPRIDEAALGAHVACISVADARRTFWHELKRVPAEHVLIADSPEGRVAVRRGSDVLSAPARRDDPAERLDQAIADAVRDIALPAAGLGVALSGGMDSTTVAWHAARARAEAGLDSLAAYTLDFRRFPDADEREFVESALTAIRCSHTWLDADQAYPLGDWPETFASVDEPPPTFGAVGMSGVLEAAAADGATGVMTGHGADHILIASPTQRLELLASGRLLSDTRAFHRRHGSLPPLAPVLGQAARIAVLRHAPGLLALRRNPPQLDLLQREHVANSGLLDGLRREGEQYGRDTGRHRAVRDTGSQRQQRRAEHLDLLGRRAGVEFLNPFLDRRVIEVAASLPGDMIFAEGETKVALRRTMEGRLPNDVIGKRIPTARGGPYAFGLGADDGPDIVRRLFADPALARIGVVDAAKLRQAHKRFLAGDRSQLTQLVSAVGGEIWLRRETGEALPD